MGDADYFLAFSRVLVPVAMEFRPELVIISAGFDSGKGDPWGECNVTPNGFANLTAMLMNISRGRLVMVLEGGYNLKTVSHSLAACVGVLRGHMPPPLDPSAAGGLGVPRGGSVPSLQAVADIAVTENTHSAHWRSLYAASEVQREAAQLAGNTTRGRAVASHRVVFCPYRDPACINEHRVRENDSTGPA